MENNTHSAENIWQILANRCLKLADQLMSSELPYSRENIEIACELIKLAIEIDRNERDWQAVLRTYDTQGYTRR